MTMSGTRRIGRVLAMTVCVSAWPSLVGVVAAAGAGGEEGSMRPGGGPPHRPEITPAQVDEVMAFVETHFPIAYNVLSRVEERNPRAFRRRIQQMAPRVLEMKHAMQDDPPIGRLLIADFRFESEIIQLRRQYRDARDAAKKQSLREELEERIGRQFDVQLQRQTILLERLETRLDAQRQRVDQQAERRDQIINERLQDALDGRPATADSDDE